MNAKACACALSLALTGCITVTTVNIGTKTSLERQLIGELEPLTEEELLAASVRATPLLEGGALADLQAAAVAAKRRQAFNRDDIALAKEHGCLGEARGAALVVLPCKTPLDEDAAGRLAALVEEENKDRAAIIDWALRADSSMTPIDRPELVRVYHRLLLQNARAGELVERDDGTFAEHTP